MINNRVIKGYNKAKQSELKGGFGSGVGFNDNWNKAKFGITQSEYQSVLNAIHEKFGTFGVVPKPLKLKDIV